jgi:hypothetical protein
MQLRSTWRPFYKRYWIIGLSLGLILVCGAYFFVTRPFSTSRTELTTQTKEQLMSTECQAFSADKLASVLPVNYWADSVHCVESDTPRPQLTFTFAFSTPDEKMAQQAIKSQLTSQQQYPHTLRIIIQNFATKADMQVSVKTQKTDLSTSTDESVPTVVDTPNLAKGAFSVHVESTADDTEERAFIEDTAIVPLGQQVVSIYLRQTATSQPYETAPLEVAETLFAKLLATIKSYETT